MPLPYPPGTAVSLEDIPSAAELIRAARVEAYSSLSREPTFDRPLLSLNDWYGAGFLDGMGAPILEAKKQVHWYCGKQGAYEQFENGRHHALMELIYATEGRKAKRAHRRGDAHIRRGEVCEELPTGTDVQPSG